MKSLVTSFALIAVALLSTQAFGGTSVQKAVDNATVKPAGPRTGTSGKSFLNVEGDDNAANASYGVIDFSGTSFGISGSTVVTSLTLSLSESNAAFSLPGGVEVYLASVTTADIQPTDLALTYTLGLTPEGLGSTAVYGTLTDLGTVSFPTTGNVNSGTVDSLTLSSVPAGVSSYIVNALNTGGTIRLVLTPNSTSTAATWAGYSSTTFTAPTLSLTTDGTVAVPEPTSLALCGVGAVLLMGRRRRQA